MGQDLCAKDIAAPRNRSQPNHDRAGDTGQVVVRGRRGYCEGLACGYSVRVDISGRNTAIGGLAMSGFVCQRHYQLCQFIYAVEVRLHGVIVAPSCRAAAERHVDNHNVLVVHFLLIGVKLHGFRIRR
jgi:hypothetical protein